jgi:DUF4097 and DUF4098 domain-containing protein YvlB
MSFKDICSGLILATTVVVLGGCVLDHSEESETERFRFDVGGSSQIEARIDDGSIEVIGTASDKEVRIEVIKRARGSSPEAASAMLDRISVDARQSESTVRIEARERAALDKDDFSVRWGSLRSDVEMRVPRTSELELVTQDGRIVIERIEGHIEAETEDGRIRLREVVGAVRARTSDGSVAGRDLEGDIDISTDDGRIELDGRFGKVHAVTSDGSIKLRCHPDSPPPTGDWLIRSSDGSITLTLPRGFSADIEASTSDGRIVSELPLTEAEQSKSWLKGRLGDGGPLILVKTLDGRITLRSR